MSLPDFILRVSGDITVIPAPNPPVYDLAGTAAGLIAAHTGTADPHPQYLTLTEGNSAYDATGTAATLIAAHTGTADPHPQYLTLTEGNAAYAPIANGVTNGDSHDHNGGDGAQIAHTSLSSIGTNTHAQIDSHIASTSNPHSVTLAQVGFVSETEQTGTSYTLALADNFTVVAGNNAAAIAITVPPNSSVAFPTGSVVGIRQKGAGQITITAGLGVTLNAPGSALKTLRQYSEASLRKIATDTWAVIGELTV